MAPVKPRRDCPVTGVNHTALLFSLVFLQSKCAPPVFHVKFFINF
jgi:hypothetical protein